MPAEKTELRGLCPTDLVQALDALDYTEGKDRNTYVNEVLHAHVAGKAHAAIMLTRMLRDNAYLVEYERSAT